jgi:hypothetical protein
MTKKTFIFTLLLALVVGGGVGYYIGVGKGEATQQEKLGGLVDLVFPKPPEMIGSASGIIIATNNSSLTLETNDPEDYLPHTDGTPPKKISRTVNITPTTKILLIDSTKIDTQGNPKITELQIGDLKTGDGITVRTKSNIRTTNSFDADQIEIVKY